MPQNLTTEEFNAFLEFFMDSEITIEELNLMDELETPLED